MNLDALRGYHGGLLQLAADTGLSLSSIYRVINTEHSSAPIGALMRIADALLARSCVPGDGLSAQLSAFCSYPALREQWERERAAKTTGDGGSDEART